MYAKDFKFLPMGSQMPDETGCRFAVGQQQMLPQGVQAVNSDILVAKLRPGQIIDLEAHCIKGTYSLNIGCLASLLPLLKLDGRLLCVCMHAAYICFCHDHLLGQQRK